MSQTYIAVIVMVLSQLMPKLGLEIGNDALTTSVSTLLLIGGAVWALVRRHQAGGIDALGVRKS